jgi:hypothetical protein
MCAILAAPHVLPADPITGGMTNIAKDNGPDANRKRYNVTTSFTASYQTFCSWLINGMQSQFSGVNFTFAGYGNIGGLFSQVPSTDFALTQYQPWVDYSTNGTNPLMPPNGFPYSRGVSDQDSGGLNMVLTYTPRANSSDPNIVNFVQAYVDNVNNTGFSSGSIDNLQDSTPFYNNIGLHGTDSSQSVATYTNTVGSGMNAQGSSAWIADTPYKCASFIPTATGGAPPGANLNCTGGQDGTLTSDELVFQTFLESTQTLYYNANDADAYSRTNNGGQAQTWDVLYGGVQWGFTYTNALPGNAQPVAPPEPSPTPEPASVLLVGSVLVAGVWGVGRRRLLVFGR